MQNDILFEPQVGVAASQDGEPLCARNPDLDQDVSFAFLPQGCTPGVDCTGIRAIVGDTGPVSPIPTGSVLYACTIAVAGSTSPGDYPLTCADAGATNGDGGAVETTCDDGVITVIGTIPTPTGTPLPPTATATPPPRTPTRTHFPPPPPVEDDGCQIASPATAGGPTWLLALPALLLVCRRRRESESRTPREKT